MKYFRMSYDEVVFRRSYLTLLLLNRAIPGIKPYKGGETGETEGGGRITRHAVKGRQHANDFFEALM